MSDTMWLDDFEVGTTIYSDDTIVTQQRISEFADVGGDHNPLHLDNDYAATRRPFKKLIAHGELGAAIITAEGAKVIGYESIILHTDTHTEFKRPIFPGDVVHVEMTAESIDANPTKPTGFITFNGKLINHNNIILAEGTRTLMMYKKPQPKP